jgi:hypothetical protein
LALYDQEGDPVSTPTPKFTQQEVSMLLDGLEAFTPNMTIRELAAKQELLNKLARLLPNVSQPQT